MTLKIVDLLLGGLDILIEKIPIGGSLKRKYEEGIRPLSERELASLKWATIITGQLNDTFQKPLKRNLYKESQIRNWINQYPEVFIVFVQKRLLAKKAKRERIVLMIKLIPLKEDLVKQNPESFDPYNIDSSDLAVNLRNAKAIWIGDLISTNKLLQTIILLLKFKIENLSLPVYCRTSKEQLRNILFERYGARVLKPSGEPATGKTILVLNTKFKK